MIRVSRRGFVAAASCAVLSMIVPVSVAQADTKIEHAYSGDFEYIIGDEGAVVTAYLGHSENVKVPEELGGSPVVALGDKAFFWCWAISSLSMPNSIKYIGKRAFDGCDSLTTILIPDSVELIAPGAFEGCESMESITVGPNNEHYASIDGCLFDKIDKSLIYYPAGRVNASYTVPDGILCIAEHAFFNCRSISSVTIPASVESIGLFAFDGCYSLEDIIVDSDNKRYSSVEGCLVDYAEKTFICRPCGMRWSAQTVPDGIEAIEARAFARCNSVEYIFIPSSVNQIGEQAFYGCDSLSVIDVDTKNGRYSSADGFLVDDVEKTLICCPGGMTMSVLDVPDGVLAIGNEACDGCDSLEAVTIPPSVTSIGDRAFSFCNSLVSVAIPPSVTSIGHDAFAYCSDGLTLIVDRGSYAAQWADENEVFYTYADANDWLKS